MEYYWLRIRYWIGRNSKSQEIHHPGKGPAPPVLSLIGIRTLPITITVVGYDRH